MRCKENGASINAFPHLLCSSFQLECKVGRTCLPSFQLVPRICCSPESLDSGIVTPKSEQKEKWEYPGCRDAVISGVPSRWQGPFRTANNNNNNKKSLTRALWTLQKSWCLRLKCCRIYCKLRKRQLYYILRQKLMSVGRMFS